MSLPDFLKTVWATAMNAKAPEVYGPEGTSRALLETSPFYRSVADAQLPPSMDAGPWRNWLFMGGRGAGKTRAGAEFIRLMVSARQAGSIALVGQSIADAREVMIEGPSGLRHLNGCGERPRYEVTRRRLVWDDSQAVAHVYSAEDPESLRGPEFDLAWGDEVASWAYGRKTWDTLQMGLRAGAAPIAVATTTPRALSWIKGLAAEPHTAVTRAGTADNEINLAPGFVSHLRAAYGSSELARQEIDGELIDDPKGAQFKRSVIDLHRSVVWPVGLARIVVAVDPCGSSRAGADACGIVAVGLGAGPSETRRGYVLGDASAHGLTPLGWAMQAARLAEDVGADEIIVEANMGGEMVEQTLKTGGVVIPVRRVHARLSKRARAAPVAALYEAGRVSHIGRLDALEDEMCRFGAEGFGGSPDRVDALVWGLSALMLRGTARPRVRVI